MTKIVLHKIELKEIIYKNNILSIASSTTRRQDSLKELFEDVLKHKISVKTITF